MDAYLWVEKGVLALDSSASVCSETALAGPSLHFRGSVATVYDALTGLMYLVRKFKHTATNLV